MPFTAIEIQDIPAVTLSVSALLAVSAVLAVWTKRLRLPLTLILVIVGFLAGVVARANDIELPIEGEAFEQVLLFVFLPVLVFEAALGLPARVFARNIVPILTLAIVALLISTVLVGLLVHFGLGVSLTAALLFGALISATDPVAVTATFRELGVPSRLLVLVEGESLLNDGIAIVLFNILLVAALGTGDVGIASGVADFLYVFVGGVALGAILGFGVAEVAARLGRLPSTAMTIALAYGAFALGEEIFGFSGVMASAAAGLVLSALSKTLIPSDEAATWHSVWESLAFVANGILFILIGVVIDGSLIADNLDAIALGVFAVMISRPLAIFPVMPIVTRLARIPDISHRNELVLVWGGLRGGVALALALAIPESLPEREQFIAMTAGVVLATLIFNATTIGKLIRHLGLDRATPMERFVAAAARFEGARTARRELGRMLHDPEVDHQLGEVERAVAEEISSLDLEPAEIEDALLRRGLAVERASLQELVDNGLVPQWHARVAINALEDQLDELAVGGNVERGLFEAHGFGRLVYEIARRIHLGRITPEKFVDIAWRDFNARLKATADAIQALDHFRDCPGVDRGGLEAARDRFLGWQDRAERHLAKLRELAPPELLAAARRSYAGDLARVSSHRQLRHLANVGLVSSVAVGHAAELIMRELERSDAQRSAPRGQP